MMPSRSPGSTSLSTQNRPRTSLLPVTAQWTRDLFAGVNRAVGPSDFTVVEDTSTGKIVSSLCLISQTWNIGGIDTPMGMPEIVGTHPTIGGAVWCAGSLN